MSWVQRLDWFGGRVESRGFRRLRSEADGGRKILQKKA
jgi:hypothetical protein